jgi:tetratricopeptide (TPR) repeat protein
MITMPRPHANPPLTPWLDRAALGLLLATVAARCCLSEIPRDPLPVTPGGDPSPRGAMAAASLALDLLMVIPALSVLAARTWNANLRRAGGWGIIVLAALATWATASVFWSADKFAALVSALNLCAAVAGLYAASQLVRDWADLRRVAGLAAGLLLVLLAHGFNARLVDWPDTLRQWDDPQSPNSKLAYLKSQGLSETDFQFRQFDRKLRGGELRGFSASSNTYSAMIAVTLAVLMGLVAQKLADGQSRWVWLAPAGCVAVAAAWVLRYTYSRQAAITPLLALAVLGILRLWGTRLAQRRTLAYWACVALFGLGAAAIVTMGMSRGSLLDRSLTFRWYYWTGAARLFRDHWLSGVGLANFGMYYPSVRLLQATEQVQDPHNILVRGFAELGLVGGILLIVGLMRLTWEMAVIPWVPRLARKPCPDTPAARVEYNPLHQNPAGSHQDGQPRNPLRGLIALAAGALLLQFAVGADFSLGNDWLMVQGFYTLCFAGLLLTGLLVANSQGVSELRLDNRPAPWILYGVIVAVGVSFLHNLLDFSWSEAGPLCLAAILAGSALGMRSIDAPQRCASRRSTALTLTALAVCWLAGVVLAVKVAVAEESAAAGDLHVRTGQAARASEEYANAARTVPFNGEYYFMETRALLYVGGQQVEAAAACDRAVAANPRVVRYHALRGEIEMNSPQPDASVVRRCLGRATELDPNDAELHLIYAQALRKLGDQPGAVAQFALALRIDDALPVDEPRRLSNAKRLEAERIVNVPGAATP